MSDLDQFRRNFALVWNRWMARGEETRANYEEAGRNVKKHMNDAEWMDCASSHFSQMADAIRRDEECAERIRNEVRQTRRAA